MSTLLRCLQFFGPDWQLPCEHEVTDQSSPWVRDQAQQRDSPFRSPPLESAALGTFPCDTHNLGMNHNVFYLPFPCVLNLGGGGEPILGRDDFCLSSPDLACSVHHIKGTDLPCTFAGSSGSLEASICEEPPLLAMLRLLRRRGPALTGWWGRRRRAATGPCRRRAAAAWAPCGGPPPPEATCTGSTLHWGTCSR